jgi:hypothetical protein
VSVLVVLAVAALVASATDGGGARDARGHGAGEGVGAVRVWLLRGRGPALEWCPRLIVCLIEPTPCLAWRG